jgi:hypothetical protein
MPADEAKRKIRGHIDRLSSLIGTRHESSGPLGVLRENLDAALGRLMAVAAELTSEQPTADSVMSADWWESAVPHIDALDTGLLEWHRYVSLGP